MRVSDEDLMRMSEDNPGWRFERADDGALLVSPNATSGGAQSGEALVQLYAFAKVAGGKAYDASAGFKTPGGGVVCPDAAWVTAERVAMYRDHKGFWPIVPDVAIEVASPSDSWAALKRKIDRYVRDGATYAIAIDPESRDVYEGGKCPENLDLDIEAIVNG